MNSGGKKKAKPPLLHNKILILFCCWLNTQDWNKLHNLWLRQRNFLFFLVLNNCEEISCLEHSYEISWQTKSSLLSNQYIFPIIFSNTVKDTCELWHSDIYIQIGWLDFVVPLNYCNCCALHCMYILVREMH